MFSTTITSFPSKIAVVGRARAKRRDGVIELLVGNFGDALSIFSFCHLPIHKKVRPLKSNSEAAGWSHRTSCRPVLQTVERIESLHPIGGGEGAFCYDCGVLVLDEVSDGADFTVRHEMSLRYRHKIT